MLYIFDKDDKFKNIITEDTGLIDTWFKDYQNHLIDEPFVFHVDSESELLPLIVAENQVAFKHTFNALQQDVEMLKLMRIKEIDEIYNNDGYIVEVTCEPSWLELYDHFIEDRRIENGTAQTAMDRALEGSRWIGADAILTGNGSTNFYWIDAVEALFKIAEEWGGTLQDYITLDDKNEIATQVMYLLPRLGRDNGLLIQPDYNAETIERRTLSYPVTAMWGQGASLEIEDEEGNHTGGYTRYITFEDVEWKKSKGDPVDKPKGQKWVGDPQALAKYGYLKDDGTRMHRFSHFSNQDYETPEDLLWATWEALQKEKEPEIYHEAVIDEVDKPIFLGDTGTILDRHYGKPIEVQSQITGLEYDILRHKKNVKIALGKYKDMSRDPLEDEIDEIKNNQKKPPIIGSGNFPNKKPMKPVNVEAVGGWETIQVTWTYTDEIYVSHYEVYASQMQGFVPDSQYKVYSGKVSAFGHEVKSDEVWYYRVCAVNYHDVKSEYSDEATARTVRIPLEMTEFEDIVNDAIDKADEAYDNANIATQNAADAITKAQDGFDKATEALGQSDLALEQADESFQKALENATSVENLALRIVSTNMISHDSDNWVQGYWATNTGNGVITSNNIRTDTETTIDLTPGEEYTLTSYGDYEARINIYSESNYLTYFHSGKNESNTFTVPDGASFGRISIRQYHGEENITPDMIGDEIKIKLEKGDVSSEWTMHDPDYTNIVATQKGIQTEVGNVKNDVTTVTQVAQGLDVRVSDNENNITNLQITSQGISGQLQSVNTRLDELDSDDRNLITHLPANWEIGYINNSTGDHVSDSTTIRTIDYYDIKPSEEYILQTYGNYEIILLQYDSSKNPLGLTNRVIAGKSFGNAVFTSHNNARYYRAYFRRLNDPAATLNVDMVGTTLKSKLHMGNEPVEWTPNIMDTGELVNQVQSFVHDFNVTAESLSSRIQDNLGNINQLASTVDGTQQTISNMQGDINTITNLANVNQQQISNLDGDVNTLTQTVNATVSRLENMSGNMITHNVDEWEQGFYNTSGNKQNSSTSIRTKDMFTIEQNKTYTVSAHGKHSVVISLFTTSGNFIRRITTTGNTNFTTASNERRYTIYASTSDTTGSNITPDDIGTEVKVQLEKGEYASDWQDHAGDTYSQYSQLTDAINLRVAKGDVRSQINIEADRVLIDTTGRLVLNAQTTLISNAVIKDAHIDSLNGRKIVSKSIVSDKLDVTNLSAITSRLGTVTSGRLLSQNNNMDLNLNTGDLTMQRANFTLGSGAFIKFTDRGNRIQYDELLDGAVRYAGLGVGQGTSEYPYPISYIGTSTASGGKLDNTDSSWTGVTVLTQRAHSEGAYSTLTGDWMVRDELNYNKAVRFDLRGNRPSINLVNAYNYEYDIDGLMRIYARNDFSIQNMFVTSSRPGWIIQTQYSGDGSAITLRGLNGGSHNYQIGSGSSTANRIQAIYLKNQPNVSSDERLKEDIKDLELGLDFINEIKAKQFRLIPTTADKNQGITRNKIQLGIIAQQVNAVLSDFGMLDSSLITGTEEEMYGASYEQFIAPLIKAVQELSTQNEQQQNIIDDLLLKVAKMEAS